MWADPAVCQVLIDAGADIETKDDMGRSPLHWACRSGALAVVKLLVKAGAWVRVTDNFGNTCLMCASSQGHTETVRYLVGLEDVDLNNKGYYSCSALVSAVCENHADVVKVLIDAGADIEGEDDDGRSPLLIASCVANVEIVKMLVKAGAGVRVADNEENTCLILAAHCGHTETVRHLVGLPEVDLGHKDRDGFTALHCAADEKHSDVVVVLIDAGADIEAKDCTGRSPLHVACRSGTLDVVKLLVKAGAGVRVTDNEENTCLIIAAHSGHTETVRYLVGLPQVDVSHKDNDGCTALHCAADQNDADAMEVLIDAGADIEAMDDTGCPLLYWACHSGVLSVVKLLVKAGAGVRVTDNEGITCLMCASEHGRTETVRYLLGLPEVDVNDSNNSGPTSLHRAVLRKHSDVVKVLIDAGADVEAMNDGRTPLHCACVAGNPEIVQMLVEAGADVCAVDNKSDRCLSIAARYGHTETVRYLVGLPEVDVNHRNLLGHTALDCARKKQHADVVQVLLEQHSHT